MKITRFVVAAALLLAASAAVAQQVQNHAIPVGRGGGVQGFGAIVPSTAGRPLIDNGASADPGFGTIANNGITPGAADTAKGSLNGTTVTDLPLPSCTAVNQAWRYASGVGVNCATISVTAGFDTPVNLGLSASASAGALTLNVTQQSGAAPSSSNPVLVPFRSLTATSGVVTYRTISSALSLTIPSGATLGASDTVPFRVWIFLNANGGTPAIGVATCSNSTTVFPCASWEYSLKTSVTIDTGADSGGTLYATAGVTLDAVRIVGYCDFSSGLATAGTWSSSCTSLQVFGPGIKKPGDVVQTVRTSLGTSATGTTAIPQDNTIPQITEGDQVLSQAITPSSTVNLIEIDGKVVMANNSGTALTAALFQDATANALTAVSVNAGASGQVQSLDLGWSLLANTVSTTTFKIRIGGSSGTTTLNGAGGTQQMGGAANSFIRVKEIMG